MRLTCSSSDDIGAGLFSPCNVSGDLVKCGSTAKLHVSIHPTSFETRKKKKNVNAHDRTIETLELSLISYLNLLRFVSEQIFESVFPQGPGNVEAREGRTLLTWGMEFRTVTCCEKIEVGVEPWYSNAPRIAWYTAFGMAADE